MAAARYLGQSLVVAVFTLTLSSASALSPCTTEPQTPPPSPCAVDTTVNPINPVVIGGSVAAGVAAAVGIGVGVGIGVEHHNEPDEVVTTAAPAPPSPGVVTTAAPAPPSPPVVTTAAPAPPSPPSPWTVAPVVTTPAPAPPSPGPDTSIAPRILDPTSTTVAATSSSASSSTNPWLLIALAILLCVFVVCGVTVAAVMLRPRKKKSQARIVGEVGKRLPSGPNPEPVEVEEPFASGFTSFMPLLPQLPSATPASGYAPLPTVSAPLPTMVRFATPVAAPPVAMLAARVSEAPVSAAHTVTRAAAVPVIVAPAPVTTAPVTAVHAVSRVAPAPVAADAPSPYAYSARVAEPMALQRAATAAPAMAVEPVAPVTAAAYASPGLVEMMAAAPSRTAHASPGPFEMTARAQPGPPAAAGAGNVAAFFGAPHATEIVAEVV